MTEDQLIESILKRMRSEQLVVVTTEQARRAACFDDLLAALKLAYRELNGGFDSLTAIEHKQAHEFARAAIAKAEGRDEPI